MGGFTRGQRRILSDFLTTIAAGWFGAGVITTVFLRPLSLQEAVINVVIGVILSSITLSFILYLERKKK